MPETATEPGTGRRWYAAYHPEGAGAIIRAKDAAGFKKWRSRSWRAFPAPPVIADVTHSMGKVFADLNFPGGAVRDQTGLAVVLCVTEAGPAVRVRDGSAPALPGEVANLGSSFKLVLGGPLCAGFA